MENNYWSYKELIEATEDELGGGEGIGGAGGKEWGNRRRRGQLHSVKGKAHAIQRKKGRIRATACAHLAGVQGRLAEAQLEQLHSLRAREKYEE